METLVMRSSHLQTRTLNDALNGVDTILSSQETRLATSAPRRELAGSFALNPTRGFQSWAYTASGYEQVGQAVRKCAPELLGYLKAPLDDRDFTAVGHCSLDLRFTVEPNSAQSVPHRLRDGTRVRGARVSGGTARRYSSGPIALPATGMRFVYLFQPNEPLDADAGQMACQILKNCGTIEQHGVEVTFPEARTQQLPDYGWVTQLTSEDGQSRVGNFVNIGAAILNHHGFFAHETQVVQMEILSLVEERPSDFIDNSFLAFFADDLGVHTAAWFDRDSFVQ